MSVLYFLKEPKSLTDCISFFCRLQFLMCCLGFYKRGVVFTVNLWTHLYTVCTFTFLVCGLWSSLYYLLQDEVLRERILSSDNLVLSIGVLELVMSMFVALCTMCFQQLVAHQHIRIYQRLTQVDERLIRDFGANLNYGKLKQKNIVVLTAVTVIYLGAMNTALGSMISNHLTRVLFGCTCYGLLTGGPHFTGYKHMNTTELLYIRFRLLQKIINPKFLSGRFGKGQLLEQRLHEAVGMVKELHYLIQEINEVYSVSLWSAMAHDFTLCTSELFIILGRSRDSSFSLALISFLTLCMLPPLYKMLVGPVYCDRTVREGQRCLRLLSLLDVWFPGSPAIRKLVGSLLYWRLENKIEFMSGLGIVLNKMAIASITSLVVNYLLILIQFSMTQQMGEQIEEQKTALQDWIGI